MHIPKLLFKGYNFLDAIHHGCPNDNYENILVFLCCDSLALNKHLNYCILESEDEDAVSETPMKAAEAVELPGVRIVDHEVQCVPGLYVLFHEGTNEKARYAGEIIDKRENNYMIQYFNWPDSGKLLFKKRSDRNQGLWEVKGSNLKTILDKPEISQTRVGGRTFYSFPQLNKFLNIEDL